MYNIQKISLRERTLGLLSFHIWRKASGKGYIMRNKQKFKLWMTVTGIVLTGMFLGEGDVWAAPEKQTERNGAYADVNTCLNIREGAGTQHPVLAQRPKNGYCEVERREGDWCYITSDEISGYVFCDYLETGFTKEEYLTVTNQKEMKYAYSLQQKENVAAAASIGGKRQEIVDFALQFVGNPYVWGGTSLTNGADCSGFVQSIYKQFGISLPRVAADQANAGTRISVEEALPGDLIFYAENGSVYHVVMYIGNGKVVHASSSASGIKVSDLYRAHAVSGARFFIS